ncbi:hypothetical protein DB30_00745 [Enhygromyxa salina]|uniref:Uncharacterized protein n=1 Tax=Enhygromyxa salina TaxID=215803 RepID=A0A0C2DAA0_9BACT|nr:hypothetical protein [Enhygromyxa salina]KIG18460.1 hypothetical protein DB30_00745 [Enhygromyxa salina]
MTKLAPLWILLPLLPTAIACGPAGIAADAGADAGSTSDSTLESSSTTADATSTSETQAPSTEDGTETSGFVPPNDDSMIEPCDTFAQDCPDGEKCVPYSPHGSGWDAHKCVPIMGDQAPGEPCISHGIVEATDDCDGTSFCWDVQDVDGQPVGTCAAFCTGSPDDPQCPPGSSCLISGDSTISLCIFGCDPTLQDCDVGQACYWTNNGFNCMFTTDDAPAGQPCNFVNDCAAGLGCTSADALPACEAGACCTPFCDIDLGDAQCDAVPGTSCVPFFEADPIPGLEHVGVCISP